ncbi:MAG: SEC-C metal-binding domain-containing protein [bacterium]
MKSFSLIFLLAILSCFLIVILFLGIGILASLFLPVSAFQTALLLIAPFCCLLILFPLLLINQKMEEMVVMMEEDYMLWDDEWTDNKTKMEKKKRTRAKQRQNKIIVMGNSPIIEQDAPCPCGSGKKYKNCCGEKNQTKKNEGE